MRPMKSLLLVCLSATLLAQSGARWRPLFSGKDLNGWTQTGAAQWKVEDGAMVGGQAEPGQRGSSLVSVEQFRDFELELDYLLAEQPSASDGSCDTCTYNSGVYLRTGYQVNFGRREAGEFIGVVVHRVHPKAIRGNVLWLDTGDEKFPGLRKKRRSATSPTTRRTRPRRNGRRRARSAFSGRLRARLEALPGS